MEIYITIYAEVYGGIKIPNILLWSLFVKIRYEKTNKCKDKITDVKNPLEEGTKQKPVAKNGTDLLYKENAE